MRTAVAMVIALAGCGADALQPIASGDQSTVHAHRIQPGFPCDPHGGSCCVGGDPCPLTDCAPPTYDGTPPATLAACCEVVDGGASCCQYARISGYVFQNCGGGWTCVTACGVLGCGMCP
jgi:hypothetical protein